MSDSPTSENSDIVPQQSKKIISLDDFKSFYYQLNAKPDTETRLLPGRKILELADIRNIYEQIVNKLENHEIVAEIASINFILSNRKIKDYSNWSEFKRENWDTINERIKTVSINWDILIKVPKYELPQRHSIKLRIEPDIPPKDLFQLIFTSDNISKLIEAKIPSICKIDFINNIIATELLNIVSNWYDGLKSCPETDPVQNFLEKQGKSFSQLIRYMSPAVFLLISCFYSNFLFHLFRINNELSTESIQKMIVLLITIFMLGSWLGARFEIFIDKRIDQLEEYPRFYITRGDKNAIEEYDKNNNKLIKQITSRIFWIIVTIILSTCLKPVINYLLKVLV